MQSVILEITDIFHPVFCGQFPWFLFEFLHDAYKFRSISIFDDNLVLATTMR